MEDPNNKKYETDYLYDPLENLTSVTQKGDGSGNRVRSFSYDSLSRLTSAANPESGTISYTYSNSSSGCASSPGIVCTKAAPAANQTGTATATTTYAYDALNRLTGKTYAGVTTPSVYYGYDHDASTLSSCATTPPTLADTYPISYRTAMCDGSGATSWTHDQMGRIKQERRTIGTVKGDYETDAYNLDGSVASLTALGYAIAYTYNAAGRAITATNSADPFNYVTSANYAPFAGLAAMSMGPKPITVSNTYNSRLQPAVLSAGTSAATILSLSYDFHSSSKTDNGNVYQIVNGRDGNRTANFHLRHAEPHPDRVQQRAELG